MKTNIDNMKEELAGLLGMTDEEICKKYNVDCKEEAVMYIVDYWI